MFTLRRFFINVVCFMYLRIARVSGISCSTEGISRLSRQMHLAMATCTLWRCKERYFWQPIQLHGLISH